MRTLPGLVFCLFFWKLPLSLRQKHVQVKPRRVGVDRLLRWYSELHLPAMWINPRRLERLFAQGAGIGYTGHRLSTIAKRLEDRRPFPVLVQGMPFYKILETINTRGVARKTHLDRTVRPEDFSIAEVTWFRPFVPFDLRFWRCLRWYRPGAPGFLFHLPLATRADEGYERFPPAASQLSEAAWGAVRHFREEKVFHKLVLSISTMLIFKRRNEPRRTSNATLKMCGDSSLPSPSAAGGSGSWSPAPGRRQAFPHRCRQATAG